jgi:hypothetical protein
MTTQTQTVATIIHQQIGRKALLMLGAKNVVSIENGLQFNIRGSQKANKIVVVLDLASDTYTVSFWMCRGVKFRQVSEHDGIYVDGLHRLIERETGLYTSL